MSPTIELESLSKHYGALRAVDDLTLDVAPGECLALLGHNGAGKTTLMKLMLGLTRPTSGRARVLGVDPAGTAAVARRAAIGFLPENVAFHDAMTGREVLNFYLRLKGSAVAESGALLARVGLGEAADNRVKTYSKGMRQRLGLAQALIGEPRLLLLDEPTTGLDPMLRQHFYRVIRELADSGTTVVLSSHVLTELEARTDRVVIMRRGRVAASGSLAELRRAVRLPVRFRLSVINGATSEVAARIGGIGLAQINGNAIELTCGPEDKMAVLRELSNADLAIADIDIIPPSLDDVYAHFGNGEAT